MWTGQYFFSSYFQIQTVLTNRPGKQLEKKI